MARNNRESKNNNPTGRNQYSGGGVMEMARDRPMAAAAVTAAAVGAGVFLWSRRSQISEQLTTLSDQISEWSDNLRSTSADRQFETTGSEQPFIAGGSSGATAGSRRGKRSQSDIAEEALTLKETGAASGTARM